MTDYNDGKWHAHNGGECPVHHKTVVEIQTYGDGGGNNEGAASSFLWSKEDWRGNPIIAFRVLKEHKEPREFWLSKSDGWIGIFETKEESECADLGSEIIHVREITET